MTEKEILESIPDPRDAAVFLYLRALADDNGIVPVSAYKIATDLKLSRFIVHRMLKRLAKTSHVTLSVTLSVTKKDALSICISEPYRTPRYVGPHYPITCAKGKETETEKKGFPPDPFTKEKDKEKERENSATATNVRACTREGDSLDAEISSLKNSPLWLEQICIQHHINPSNLDSLFAEFITECRCNALTGHTDLADAKRHFNSWLRIKQRNGNNRQTNSQYPTDEELIRGVAMQLAQSSGNKGTAWDIPF